MYCLLLKGTKLPTDYLELKAAACSCVGTYAENTLEAFAPYIEECATALLGNINYGYDPITTGIVKSITRKLYIPM